MPNALLTFPPDGEQAYLFARSTLAVEQVSLKQALQAPPEFFTTGRAVEVLHKFSLEDARFTLHLRLNALLNSHSPPLKKGWLYMRVLGLQQREQELVAGRNDLYGGLQMVHFDDWGLLRPRADERD